MPRLVAALALATTLVSLAAPAALADDRFFPFSYPYNTADHGERELELYTDFFGGALENQLEFEYGLTDRLTVAGSMLAKNLQQYDGFKLEGRYRLAEQNELPVDTGLYLEYENAQGEGPTLEYKLLLEKTLGNWIVDSNLIGERHFDDGSNEFQATLAGGYTLADGYVAGLEGYYDAGTLFVGPTFAYFPGPFHATAGVYYYNDGANQLRARLVLAQEF